MIKNLAIAVLLVFSLTLFAGCGKIQQAATGLPATGQESVDDVAEGISGISGTEEELDTSGLDDLDMVLSDIENS